VAKKRKIIKLKSIGIKKPLTMDQVIKKAVKQFKKEANKRRKQLKKNKTKK